MKKVMWLLQAVLWMAFITAGADAPQSFSQFAETDHEALKMIQGKWAIRGRSYVYIYTNEPVRRIDGFIYYRYSVSQYPGAENLYALFKSKKTGKQYFCRGYWDKKYGFQYSSSQIRFNDADSFTVYSRDNPREIFFIAERLKEKNNGNNTNPSACLAMRKKTVPRVAGR